MRLIRQHPLLIADLRDLGLADAQVDCVARYLSLQLGPVKHMHTSEQLSERAEYNLCYVLEALDTRTFTKAIDTKLLAEHASLTPAFAQSIILMIAPWVDRFKPKVSSGNLAI